MCKKKISRAKDSRALCTRQYRTWLSPSCLPALTVNGQRRYITVYNPLLHLKFNPYFLLLISYLTSSHLTLSQDSTKHPIQQIFTTKHTQHALLPKSSHTTLSEFQRAPTLRLHTHHTALHGGLSSLRALEPATKANAKRQRRPRNKLRARKRQHI